MRILILLAKSKDETTATRALDGEIPRPEYLVLQEALGADLLDFSDVERSTHPLVVVARRRGLRYGLAMLGALARRDYDHFYCTGEDVGFPFAMLMIAAADLGRITVVIHNGGTPKRRAILRTLPHAVWRNVICLGREQHRVLVDEGRLPAGKVHLFPQWLDTRFYDPARAGPTTRAPFVLACGRESRDYETLQRAAGGAPDIPFHVVASGWAPHAGFATTDAIHGTSNVTVEAGGLSYVELRDRYAAARLVVAPVKNVTYAAGVTSMCEGMSMGKPIIATASPGIADYVDDGVSGALTPVGDAAALRAAVERLFRDPARAAEIGARNRAYAIEHLAVERYAARVCGLFGLTPRTGPFAQAGASSSR